MIWPIFSAILQRVTFSASTPMISSIEEKKFSGEIAMLIKDHHGLHIYKAANVRDGHDHSRTVNAVHLHIAHRIKVFRDPILRIAL